MNTVTTEERIRELARNLAPVRPIPPLRAALAAAVALGLVAVVGHWLLGGPGLRAGNAAQWLPYGASLAGLVMVAVGAIGAALAAAVPGREAAVRLGVRAAVLGLVLGLAGGLWGVLYADTPLAEVDLVTCLACIRRGLMLGVAPTLLACAFIVYAALRNPGLGTALALAGGVALGAGAVHATCPNDNPLHWLLAHSLTPVAAMLVLTAPLAALLARKTRQA